MPRRTWKLTERGVFPGAAAGAARAHRRHAPQLARRGGTGGVDGREADGELADDGGAAGVRGAALEQPFPRRHGPRRRLQPSRRPRLSPPLVLLFSLFFADSGCAHRPLCAGTTATGQLFHRPGQARAMRSAALTLFLVDVRQAGDAERGARD
eukprot:3134795-Rhodomonas_salina.1